MDAEILSERLAASEACILRIDQRLDALEEQGRNWDLTLQTFPSQMSQMQETLTRELSEMRSALSVAKEAEAATAIAEAEARVAEAESKTAQAEADLAEAQQAEAVAEETVAEIDQVEAESPEESEQRQSKPQVSELDQMMRH